ncbi:MAG: TetR family transcriptional regulator [Actinomycetota bacterium]
MTGSNVRGRATKRRLERVALELFDEYGFEDTTADMIAEHGGVSRRTFFHHFPNKLDVLWGDSSEQISRFSSLLFEQDDPDLRACMLEAIRQNAIEENFSELDLLRFRVVRSSQPALQIQERFDAEFTPVLAAWLAARTRRRVDDPAVRARAAALAALRRFALEEWARSGGERDIGEIAEIALAAVDLAL